jgi:hypothetical protein
VYVGSAKLILEATLIQPMIVQIRRGILTRDGIMVVATLLDSPPLEIAPWSNVPFPTGKAPLTTRKHG